MRQDRKGYWLHTPTDRRGTYHEYHRGRFFPAGQARTTSRRGWLYLAALAALIWFLA